RRLAPGAQDVGEIDGQQTIDVTVYLRPNPDGKQLPSIEELALVPPAQRHAPTDEEILQARGASASDLEAVKQFAAHAGLRVIEASAAKRSVRLEGTIDALGKAFGVSVRRYRYAAGDYRGRTGPVYIPVELRGIVRAVLGLDNRRVG